MAVEIERKFLIDAEGIGDLPKGHRIRQGYIPTQNATTVRVRVIDQHGYLTIKGPSSNGLSRLEFEYPIPLADAEDMLDRFCQKPLIEKTRHRVAWAEHIWEIDLFSGDNDGLIVAEVELQSEDDEPELPPWIQQEVTGDPRYYNSNLRRHPYCDWSDD